MIALRPEGGDCSDDLPINGSPKGGRIKLAFGADDLAHLPLLICIRTLALFIWAACAGGGSADAL